MASYTPAPISYPILRDRKKLIVPVAPLNQMVTLPPPCVKCGSPANDEPVIKTFSWHHPALYLLILLGILPGAIIYALVASSVRKKIYLSVPLCPRHIKRRKLALTLAWVLPVVGLADAFILPRLGMELGRACGIAVWFVIAGAVIWGIVTDPIRPRYIDQYRSEFTGLCEAYLQQFPPKGI